jgi:hypothetical protein
MIFSVTAKLLINYDASTSSAGELWKHYDAFTNGLMSFPVNIPGTAFYKCLEVRHTYTNKCEIMVNRSTTLHNLAHFLLFSPFV